MIDLHSHILPGLDDGSSSLEISIEMARMAVADGTNILACTPHITPSVYENHTQGIIDATQRLQTELDRREIPLHLTSGADFHICDTMLKRLRNGTAPTIGATGYFLFEPSHHVMPPRLLEFCRMLKKAGYIPILTHPERLTWIERQYDVICDLSRAGVIMQVTAGSVTGDFGKRPQYWSEKMLDEGRVDLLASDAHNTDSRPPGMSKAVDHISRRSSGDIATRLVVTNPVKVLRNEPIKERRSVARSKDKYPPSGNTIETSLGSLNQTPSAQVSLTNSKPQHFTQNYGRGSSAEGLAFYGHTVPSVVGE